MLDENRVEFGRGEAMVAAQVDRGRAPDRQPTDGGAPSHADRGWREIDRRPTNGGAASHAERGSRAIDRRPTNGGAASHADRDWREFDRAQTNDALLASHAGRGWREIDRQMRLIARRRAALDAEEAPVLLAAMRAEVHVHLGYGTFAEYLERVCGYTAHTARERIRVAEALETMPAMREALAAGDVSYSAVREMTRKIDAETEAPWLEALQGCTVREVEDALRGHKFGDLPGDRPDPAIEPRRVRLELPADVYALFLEARRAAEREAGESMTDAEFMALACRRLLDGDRPANNRPAHTIAVTTCRDCKRGWHETGSTSIELPPAAVEQARCDAIELGDVDGDTPSPTTRTIPAPIRRAVLARDRHRCVVPGCRSSQYIQVHHLEHFAVGGPHELSNLITLCRRHHRASHTGRICITSSPTGALTFTHADGRPYGAPPAATPSAARPYNGPPNISPSVIADARSALLNLGMKPVEATAALAAATSHVDRDATLDSLLSAPPFKPFHADDRTHQRTDALAATAFHADRDPTLDALLRAALRPHRTP